MTMFTKTPIMGNNNFCWHGLALVFAANDKNQEMDCSFCGATIEPIGN